MRQFQKERHLPETGVADGQTQLAMASALRERQQSERERIALQTQIQKSSFGL